MYSDPALIDGREMTRAVGHSVSDPLVTSSRPLVSDIIRHAWLERVVQSEVTSGMGLFFG